MKVMFAQRKVEFLEDFGNDIDSLIKAKEELAEATQDARDKVEIQITPPYPASK